MLGPMGLDKDISFLIVEVVFIVGFPTVFLKFYGVLAYERDLHLGEQRMNISFWIAGAVPPIRALHPPPLIHVVDILSLDNLAAFRTVKIRFQMGVG